MSTPLPVSSHFPPAVTDTPPPPSATFPLFRSTKSTEEVVVVVVVVVSLLFIHCKKKGWWLCSASSSNDLGVSVPHFTFDALEKSTNGFSGANLLGEGSFGHVYRGVLSTGKDVAVKRLKVGSGQGEREFLTEVEIISRVHHKHVVSLVGYCTARSERILVYELVPNKTLEFHLHGEGQPTLNWPTRLKIASGAAEGLAYLHEGCDPNIVHRDIKATNILVDCEFEAKIADFGLAKFTSDENSHVSTNVKGTFGYLDPEYILSGNPTGQSDVYSFGVVLLELITGRRAVDMDVSLVNWARPQLTRYLEDGSFDSLVDPRLQNDYKHDEMARMVACAAACVCHSLGHRPKMSKIVRALEGDLPLSDLSGGMRPGLSILCRGWGNSDCGTSQYLKMSRKMPLACQEYGSSHHGEPISGPSGKGPNCQTTQDLEMGRMERDSRGFSGGSTSRVEAL